MPPQDRPLIRVGNRWVPGPPVVQNPNLRSLLTPEAELIVGPETSQVNVSSLQPPAPETPTPTIVDLVSKLFSDAKDWVAEQGVSGIARTVARAVPAAVEYELGRRDRMVDAAGRGARAVGRGARAVGQFAGDVVDELGEMSVPRAVNALEAFNSGIAESFGETPPQRIFPGESNSALGKLAGGIGFGVGMVADPSPAGEVRFATNATKRAIPEVFELAKQIFLKNGGGTAKDAGWARMMTAIRQSYKDLKLPIPEELAGIKRIDQARKADVAHIDSVVTRLINEANTPADAAMDVGGIKKAKPAGITGLDESAVKLITNLFPKLDTHNKNTAFVTPKAAVRKLRAAGADETVVSKVQEWFDARKLRPAAPGELPAVARGEVYTSTGRKTRRAVNPAEVEGQIPGAPLGITSARQERELRKKYIQALEEGKTGRFFYEDSGASILEHTSGDPLTARQVTRGIAVTSPQTPVPTNTDFAIKGHNQAIAGVPVKTGKYPQEMGESISAVYQGGDMPLGPKREPFMEQIADPAGYRGRTGPIRPVNDIWQGELFGYINPDGTPKREGFSAAQHAWMDRQMDLAIREAIEKQVGGVINWNTGNAQAAGWAAAKIKAGDIPLEDAAKAYHTYLDRAHMVMSRDNFPGESSGHLAGLSSASRDIQEEFAEGIRKVLYDEKGKDLSFKQARMLQDTGLQGEGVWAEGGRIYMLPGNQVRIAVGQQKRGVTQRATNDPFIQEALKDGSLVIESQPNTNMQVIRNVSMDKEVFGKKVAPKLDQVIDDASMGLAQAIESQLTLLTGASAAAGTKVNPNTTVKSFNTVDIILPEATMKRGGAFLSDPRIQALIQTGNVVPIPLVDGVRLKNVGMESDEFASVVASLAKPKKVRGPKKGEYGTAAGEIAPPYRMSQEGQDQGFFLMNDWSSDAGKIGQAYIQAIDNPTIPNSIAIFNETAPARAKGLADFYRAFSQKYGYPLSTVLMDLNDHVAEHGFDGVKMVAKKYGVDLAKLGTLMATIALIQDQGWNES